MSGDRTYDLGLLAPSRAKWESSPALRAYYGAIYARVRPRLVPGPALELGAGLGFSRNFLPGIVLSDLEKTPFVDRAVSCYDLPAGETWGNLVAVDVLHHLRRPLVFLEQAARALRPGGRLILAEPAATPGARLAFGLCHVEPVWPGECGPPWEFPANGRGGRYFRRGTGPEGLEEFANMAMATALFFRYRKETSGWLRERGLRLAETRHDDFLGYLLTGGFSRRQFAPARVTAGLTALEERLPGFARGMFGLRLLVVIEKDPA